MKLCGNCAHSSYCATTCLINDDDKEINYDDEGCESWEWSEEKYQDGINQGYQPYWVLFCMNKGQWWFDGETQVDFMDWIMKQHRKFEPDERARLRASYNKEFLAWLKEAVTV